MSPPSDDEDALLDALDSESDPALAPYRAQRLQQLATELARAKELRSQDHGTYTEIRDEKALMDIVTGTRRCVVHFFKPDFGRCGLMDVHLEVNAPIAYCATIYPCYNGWTNFNQRSNPGWCNAVSRI